MRKKCLLAMTMFVLVAAPCWAQGYGRTCDPTGVWLGGSDPNVPFYKLTVGPESDGRYSVTYQILPNPGMYYSSYTGELRKDGGHGYTGWAVASFEVNQFSIDFYGQFGIVLTPDDFSKAEIDAVRERVVMLDCDTLQGTIDWFGWYVPMTNSKIPFVTQPQIEAIGDLYGGPIVEIYRRVSGDNCPVCPSGGKEKPPKRR
jgi:hypothetical protein